MLNNKVLIVLLLKFIGSSLFHIVSRDTNIDSDALMDIIVVVVHLLFLRDILIIFRVDFDIHPSPLFLYALLLLLSFPYINHPQYPLLHGYHPGEVATLVLAGKMDPSDPPDNKMPV